MNQLTCHDLTVTIGGRTVVEGLELAVEPGQTWAILGPNGAGKTTLLHTLAGLRPATAGEVRVDGEPLDHLPRRRLARRLGLLLQDPDPGFAGTVLEATVAGRHPHLGAWSMEGEADYRLAREALATMGLAELAGRDPATLSGGERQRLALATLFTQDVPLELLDEPTSHLDPGRQIGVLEALAARPDRGRMLSLHDANLAVRFCDHALLLYPGEGACAGPLEAVVNERTLGRLYGRDMVRLEGPHGPVFIPA
ncbi:iron complex transport system ATP-binding protein [Thiohalospira halophila DSM 15071]|uniref:Iron complex transport system ATP-binding protein n=1 Tax=Thiohalospira halophila DSM 15071 TaxID=1123397 RepID=A0A1I1SX42_9GAMM|nr:ABC transporter ATP-binding protein [Thiohalospira halophila]SFD48503.1 iron complex transport system ATP-binding protein [Thiohalospira halophila DSM 15071]